MMMTHLTLVIIKTFIVPFFCLNYSCAKRSLHLYTNNVVFVYFDPLKTIGVKFWCLPCSFTPVIPGVWSRFSILFTSCAFIKIVIYYNLDEGTTCKQNQVRNHNLNCPNFWRMLLHYGFVAHWPHCSVFGTAWRHNYHSGWPAEVSREDAHSRVQWHVLPLGTITHDWR